MCGNWNSEQPTCYGATMDSKRRSANTNRTAWLLGVTTIIVALFGCSSHDAAPALTCRSGKFYIGDAEFTSCNQCSAEPSCFQNSTSYTYDSDGNRTGGSGSTVATCKGQTATIEYSVAASGEKTGAQCVGAAQEGVAPLCQGESCRTNIVLPGGTFLQGRDDSGNDACSADMSCDADELPAHESTVSTFALDKYEVTVGRFREFVNAYVNNEVSVPAAGSGANPNAAATGWDTAWNSQLAASQANLKSYIACSDSFQTWTDTAGANETQAMNCVSWYEAFAFCVWDGGRLPTESEWEYAAAGGSEERLYPWGNAHPDCSYANFYDAARDDPSDTYNTSYCSPFGVWPVGSTPIGAGRWGHQDLAGNVWEWTFDAPAAYLAAATSDYANTAEDAHKSRVVRGGGMTFAMSSARSSDIRAASRNSIEYGLRDYYIGFRCARSAP